jgi:ribosomal protein S12 methylthiotransferase
VVAGCLVDRYRKDLEAEFPEVDLWTDLNHFSEAPEEFAALSPAVLPKGFRPLSTLTGQPSNGIPWATFARKSLTRSHSVYLKISEGCDHSCSFCSIPSFKGKQRSVPLPTLVEEACSLASQGAREITLIGQDTVAYGRDLDPGRSIHLRLLLEQLNEIDGVEWIRVLYTYPTRLADEIEWAYRNLPKCIPYLDLPLQHLSDQVLERMRRGTPYASILEHVKRLRAALPDLVVRSTCIVGFPGETAKDFRLLQERFTELEVDHLGVFRYSDEEGTRALDLERKVTRRTAEKRHGEMTEWAANFCQERALQRLGGTYQVLADHPCEYPGDLFPGIPGQEQAWWCGRWYGQAPEIDGVVFFPSDSTRAGDFVSVQLEDVLYPDYLALPREEA